MANSPYTRRDLEITLACLESGVDEMADMVIYLEMDKIAARSVLGEEFFEDALAEGNTPTEVIQRAESEDTGGIIKQTRRTLQEKGQRLRLERPVESYMENLQRVYTDREYRRRILDFYKTQILSKTISYAGLDISELEARISTAWKRMQSFEENNFRESSES